MKHPIGYFSTPGMLVAAFSWVSTLIGTDPAVADFRGCGGLTGADAGSGVSNSGASFIESITKTANAGEFLVTFAEGYRYVLHAEASLWGVQAGPGDKYTAQVHDPANEGSGRTTKLTMLVTIIGEDGTSGVRAPAELDARRVSVFCVIKTSGSGA